MVLPLSFPSSPPPVHVRLARHLCVLSWQKFRHFSPCISRALLVRIYYLVTASALISSSSITSHFGLTKPVPTPEIGAGALGGSTSIGSPSTSSFDSLVGSPSKSSSVSDPGRIPLKVYFSSSINQSSELISSFYREIF